MRYTRLKNARISGCGVCEPYRRARDLGERHRAFPLDPGGGVDGAVLRPDRLLRDESGAPADGGRPQQRRHRSAVGDQRLHAGAGCVHVPAGRIGDIFGRRRALLAGIALFGLASALCAVAPSATLVIAFRALQGVGAALIFPVSVSVLTNAFPAARAGHAIGLAYGIAGLGNAAGPLVGGLLTQTLGWRSIFWLLVPFALVSLVIGGLTVPESSDDTVPRRIDLTGLALITIGIGLFTLTFDRAPSWGWLAPGTLIAFAASIAVLAAFVVVENRVRWPLVDLSLFRNARFTSWWSRAPSPTSPTP